MSTGKVNRREFLEKSGRAALGIGLGAMVADALATPARAQNKPVNANDKIVMGVIGCGGMGTGLMHNFADEKDVEVAALCDVDTRHLDSAAAELERKTGKKPDTYRDFRRLIERKDIDAVVIATPDHWHALPFINACEAGKDVYVEKPISHDIYEGQAMVAAAKYFKRVTQVGTWQRSVKHYASVLQFVQSGKMGKIPICRAWVCGGAGVGRQQPCDPPKELDWNFWLGPAPKVPYRPNRCHGSFRWFFDYAAGMTGDWGAHMIDTVLVSMNAWHPLEVASYGGKLICGEEDDRDTPDTQIAIYKFPNFILQWEVHVGGQGLDGGGGHGAEFIGEKGSLIVDRGGFHWKPNGDFEGPAKEPASEGDWTVQYKASSHVRDFLDNIRTRGRCRSDIETMHWTTTACHLANLSYLIGRSVRWDGQRGVPVLDHETGRLDREAMECQSYRREYRKPWKLPFHKV